VSDQNHPGHYLGSVHTIIRVLLSAEKEGRRQRGRRYESVQYSRIDAALGQSEEEVEVGVYMGGEDDDIDDLFDEVVSR